jgi:nitrogen fixation NifU-like protein
MTIIMDLYQQNILDHYHRPHNRGDLLESTHQGEMSNPLCGDKVVLNLVIKDDKIIDVKWNGEGCVLTQAASSMLTDTLINQTLETAQKITSEELIKILGVPLSPSRIKCALLPLEALQKVLLKK